MTSEDRRQRTEDRAAFGLCSQVSVIRGRQSRDNRRLKTDHKASALSSVFSPQSSYCTLVEKRIVMLHSFIKKTDKTPVDELRIAVLRMKEAKNVDA
ncbi:MAG: type II toxin-antitoxin system RelE/ParE family toxin [Candidatus Accumulibacter sp.]|nr:type II toxin-antitoxin system RelE/ParE family toxin [Accumulibacter sp.]